MQCKGLCNEKRDGRTGLNLQKFRREPRGHLQAIKRTWIPLKQSSEVNVNGETRIYLHLTHLTAKRFWNLECGLQLGRCNMKKTISLKMPELGFLAGTRVALGAGLGLILADKFSSGRRRGVGWTLLGVGAATTIPLVVNLVRRFS